MINHGSSDAKLLERIQLRDPAAFTVLVERHSPQFYRIAYRFMVNRAEAEDILQDAFMKLWRRPQLWQPLTGSSFTTWFCRVIINLCLDRRKRKSPLMGAVQIEFEDIANNHDTQEESIIKFETLQFLEVKIAALPVRQRTALNLCFYEGYSHKAAAEIMQLNVKAVESLVMRAKTSLKRQFQKMGGG